jgi:hypothetical protein
MFKSRGENYIYFELEELIHLCKFYVADTVAKNYLKKTQGETVKLKKPINNIIKTEECTKVLLSKENIEFLTAIVVSKFYGKEVKIGFLIRNKIKIEELASKIATFQDLKILIDNIEEVRRFRFYNFRFNRNKKVPIKTVSREIEYQKPI